MQLFWQLVKDNELTEPTEVYYANGHVIESQRIQQTMEWLEDE